MLSERNRTSKTSLNIFTYDVSQFLAIFDPPLSDLEYPLNEIRNEVPSNLLNNTNLFYFNINKMNHLFLFVLVLQVYEISKNKQFFQILQ